MCWIFYSQLHNTTILFFGFKCYRILFSEWFCARLSQGEQVLQVLECGSEAEAIGLLRVAGALCVDEAQVNPETANEGCYNLRFLVTTEVSRKTLKTTLFSASS